jgi:hypothetical protein
VDGASRDLGALARPSAVAVWGHPRPAVDRAALAVAQRIDPGFRWLEIGDEAVLSTPAEERVLAQIPAERLFRISLRELVPGTPVPGPWTPNPEPRGPSPASAPASPNGILALPSRLLEILRSMDARERVRALVIANAERGRALYSGDAGGLRPHIRYLNLRHVTPILTACVAAPRASVLDFEFELQVESGAQYHETMVRCHQAPDDAPAPFRAGTRIPLSFLLPRLPP